MTKRIALLLVPLVAASAAVHAQSSVSLYGRVNTTIEHRKFSGDPSHTGMFSDSSYIGFRGSEDLGNGMSAGFVMEQDVDTTTGASPGFQRETHVHLAGPFGQVKAGNYDSTVYILATDLTSLHNSDTGSSADMLYAYVVPTNRKVGYISPNFGGLTFEAGYGFKDDHGYKTPYDMTLSYSTGSFTVGGGYAKWDNSDAYTIVGSFNSGPFTLAAYAQRDKNGMRWTQQSYDGQTNVAEPVLDLGRRYTARLAAEYVVGASEFHLNGGWADHYKNLEDSGAWQATAAYNFNLSRRTKLYTFYTHVDNKPNAVYAGAPRAGSDFSSFALGMRHLF